MVVLMLCLWWLVCLWHAWLPGGAHSLCSCVLASKVLDSSQRLYKKGGVDALRRRFTFLTN
jgi:hypothetical protein